MSNSDLNNDPLPHYERPLSISYTTEGLKILIDQYDAMTEGRYSRHRQLVDLNGTGTASEYPVVWAIKRIEETLEREISFNDPHTGTAILIIKLLENAMRFKDHSNFNTMVATLRSKESFLHFAGVFNFATMFHAKGLRPIFSDDSKQNMSNPDLAVVVPGFNDPLYVEVKAPRIWQFGTDEKRTLETLKAATKRKIKDCTQINKSHRGIIALNSTLCFPENYDVMTAAIDYAMKTQGRLKSSLAAIWGLVPQLKIEHSGNQVKTTLQHTTVVALNENYDGENPIKQARAPSHYRPFGIN